VSAAPQYRCDNQRRREVVRAHNAQVSPAERLNGIDFLEVDPGQEQLRVHFLEDLPGTGAGAVPGGPALTTDDVVVAGGVRAQQVQVEDMNASGAVLTVVVDRPGDFSPYELRLVDPVSDAAPAGFDTQLATVGFSFKAGCDSLLDCAAPEVCPPQLLPEPLLDYLAKDYDSFRRLMLDRLATTLPAWTERNPADLQVALVELLAYAADHLSYFQDAVATEAYLGTARRRVSVRRHARLLDYRMHEGCSARVFLHFTADSGLDLSSPVAARAGPDEPPVVFETLHDVRLRVAHNDIELYTWSDERCCLPAGATRATLRAKAEAALELAVGDYLLLEETVDPVTGGDPDPTHRQVVRLSEVAADTDRLDGKAVLEVAWDPADALAFPLCVSAEGAVTAVARGNVALADHGARRERRPLPAERPDPPGRWRREGVWIADGAELATGVAVAPPVVIADDVRIAAGARIGPHAVLGRSCRVGADARVREAVLWERVVVGRQAVVARCVVGSDARIGAGATLGAGTVLETGAVVTDHARLGVLD